MEEVEGIEAALATLNDAHTLGRYELLMPVGRGGMAIVWAARQRGTRGFSKIVAVKTMLPALSADPRFERMFLAEAEIASRIKHPNVCEITDLGEEGGLLYSVMEWIDGVSLSSLWEMEGRAIPAPIAAWIGARVARGLTAAHELADDDGAPLGIVHRDVSPQNILVAADGAVKIADFGVAKATQRSAPSTATGAIKGKVAYLAPEQIAGDALDARADVFALGVVLHEITTGAHPFRGANDLATMLAISSDDPAPEPAGVPPALAAVITRALAKDPADRYPSMRELASDLDAFVASESLDDAAAIAFFGAALRARREARSRELQAASRAADERSEHAARAPRTLARSEPPRRLRRTWPLVVGAVGVAVGVFGVRASFLREPAPTSLTTPPQASSAPTSATAQPEPTPAPSAQASAATSSSPSASARPIGRSPLRATLPSAPITSASVAPPPPTAPPLASSAPATRFRAPGF